MSGRPKPPHVMGFTEAQTRAAVESAGMLLRITSRDGDHYIATRDLRADRLNVDLVDGKVVRASVG